MPDKPDVLTEERALQMFDEAAEDPVSRKAMRGLYQIYRAKGLGVDDATEKVLWQTIPGDVKERVVAARGKTDGE